MDLDSYSSDGQLHLDEIGPQSQEKNHSSNEEGEREGREEGGDDREIVLKERHSEVESISEKKEMEIWNEIREKGEEREEREGERGSCGSEGDDLNIASEKIQCTSLQSKDPTQSLLPNPTPPTHPPLSSLTTHLSLSSSLFTQNSASAVSADAEQAEGNE